MRKIPAESTEAADRAPPEIAEEGPACGPRAPYRLDAVGSSSGHPTHGPHAANSDADAEGSDRVRRASVSGAAHGGDKNQTTAAEARGDEVAKVVALSVQRRPIRLPRAVTISLVWLCILATLYTAYFAQAIIFPMLLALLLAFLFSPIVRALRRRGIPAAVTAIGVNAGLLVAVGLFIATSLSPLTEWMHNAPQAIRKVEDKIRALQQPIREIADASHHVDNITKLGGDNAALRVELAQPTFAATVLNTSGGVLAQAGFMFVLLYFLLASGDRLMTAVIEAVPGRENKKHILELARETERQVSRYLFAVTIINVGLGIAVTGAFWLVGMPTPWLWGLIAMALNYIPYVGPATCITIYLAVGLLSFEHLTQALTAPGVYAALNAVEANLVTPTVLGRTIKLSPLMILLSLAVFAWLWGISGALIAVPLLAVIKLICEHTDSLAPVARVLSA